MITVTLNDVRNSGEALRKLAQQPMSARTAYKIARLSKAIEAEYAIFSEGQRGLIEKYAERDENGEFVRLDENSIKIKTDCVEKCNTELFELLNTEVEINAEKLQLEELDNISISPSELNTLMPFIADED